MTQKAITDALGEAGGGMTAEIVVTVLSDTTVTVTGNGKTWTGETSGNTITYKVDEYGTYTITGTGTRTRDGKTRTVTETLEVDTAKIYNVPLEVVGEFNDITWAVIQDAINDGVASSLWDVGDTKDVVHNGELKKANDTTGITFSNETYKVCILGFDHNKSVESGGKNSIHFGMKNSSGIDICFSGFAVNTTQTNSGGWDGSSMRSKTCASFLNCLPSDLKSLVAETTKYSHNTGGGGSSKASNVTATQDKIFLLSEWEVYGARKYANSAEQNYQQQYTYYANSNSKIRYQHSNPTGASTWWCRSVSVNSTDGWCFVNSEGTVSTIIANQGRGFAPGFSLIAQS